VQAEGGAHVNVAAATHVGQGQSGADLGGETAVRYARAQNAHQGMNRIVKHVHCALNLAIETSPHMKKKMLVLVCIEWVIKIYSGLNALPPPATSRRRPRVE